MGIIYAATLGQRPEAITVAFDRLDEQYHYKKLVVLHTAPQISGIAQAYIDLRPVCVRDYPKTVAHFHEIVYENGTPLIDNVLYGSVIKITGHTRTASKSNFDVTH